MTESLHIPPGVDSAVPAPARIYDYFLGGTVNFESDRAVAAMLRETMPDVVDAAWANRGFHQRAARWLAEQGIGQSIDIGSGLPTVGNTHEVVQRITPGARVVYADSDPLVAIHARGLLTAEGTVRVIEADLRDPDGLLGHPDVLGLIDFTEPVALMMTAVVHVVAPELDPWGLVRRYVAAVAPGSYLALSHVTDDKTPPATVQAIDAMYKRGSQPVYFRSRADVARLFSGLELVSPDGPAAGVVHVGEWGADDPALADSDGSRWSYCGVGRKA